MSTSQQEHHQDPTATTTNGSPSTVSVAAAETAAPSDASHPDFVNINTPPNLSAANLKHPQQTSSSSSIDTKLISSINTSIQSIKEIATTLATRKSSAKPFLDCVEELLQELKDGKDTIEDEYVPPPPKSEENENEKEKEKEEGEKKEEIKNDDNSTTNKNTKNIIPLDKNAIFCSRVADFAFDLHLEAAQCSKGVAALLSTSQTESVKIRKLARDILSNLATITSNFLIQDSGVLDHLSNCSYHSKKYHKTWHYHMHTLTQVAHTMRNAYSARRGFLSPGVASTTIPDCSEDQIGRWILHTSASVLSSVFTAETIIIDNLSAFVDGSENEQDQDQQPHQRTLEIDSRILALSQIFFESILDLIATEAAKHHSSDDSSNQPQQQSSSVASANAANISAEIRGEAKACLFQIMSRSQETAPEVFDLLIRKDKMLMTQKKKLVAKKNDDDDDVNDVEEQRENQTQNQNQPQMLPLLIDPFLRVVCDRTGSDDEAQLACVKIMTSVISSLCEQHHSNQSLLNFAIKKNSKFRVSLAKGLLFAIAASQPLVLSAGLDTMTHLASCCLSTFGIELGELYCNVLLRLLDNQNAPRDTRILIATHLRRLALQQNPKTKSTILIDFMLCLELNPRLHHVNLIQQMIAVLSKIVRGSQVQDFEDPSVSHYVTAFTARPHTAANVPFALVNSSDAHANIAELTKLDQTSSSDLSQPPSSRSSTSTSAAAAVSTNDSQGQQQQSSRRRNSSSNATTATNSPTTAKQPGDHHGEAIHQASTVAAADTSNVVLECFKTLCCIAHALSFATTLSLFSSPSSSSNSLVNIKKEKEEEQALGVFRDEINQISYCNAQQRSFQRQVDVINLSPLKTISQMFAIPLSLLKLPSDLKKTAAQVAEEAALEAELGGGENAAKVLTKEQSRELAKQIASLFMSTPSITPGTVSEFLGDPRPIASFVAEEVFERLQLKGVDICDALADMLGIITIPKEGQRIERLLERFATAYWKANKDFPNDDTFPYKTEDSCFLVIVAVVMLNTDMYNPKVTSKMSRQTFNLQLSTGNADGPFPKGFTDKTYDNIRKRPLTSSQALLEPMQTPASSPSSMIDNFFFSKTERRELVFGVERRRIVLESLILLKRKVENWSSNCFRGSFSERVRLELFGSSIVKVDPNENSHLSYLECERNGTSRVPISIRSVAREALSVAGSQLSATMNSLVSDSQQNLGITVAAASALASLLHGSAVHELQDMAQSVMSSLLRVRQRTIPLHRHIVQEILAVAASHFAPNLNESFWSLVVNLMREVSNVAQAERVFESLSQLWPLMRPSHSVPLSRVLAEAVTDLVDKVPPSPPDTRSSTELVIGLRIFVSCIECVMKAKARINDADQYLFITEWPTIMDGLCKLMTKQSKSSSALTDVMSVSQKIFSEAIRVAPEVVGTYVAVVNNHNKQHAATSSPTTQILIKNHVASLMTSIVSDPHVLSKDSSTKNNGTGLLVLHRLLVNDFLPVLLDIMVEPVQGISGEVELKSRCAHVFSSAALNFCSTSSSSSSNDNNNENSNVQNTTTTQQYLLPVCAMLLCATVGSTDGQTRESCLFALKRIRPIFPPQLGSALTFALTFASCSSDTADSVSATAVDVIGTLISCDEETGDSFFDLELCFNFIASLCCFGMKPDTSSLCNEFLTNIRQHLPPGESINRMVKGLKLVTLLPSSESFCKSLALVTFLNQLARSASTSKKEGEKVTLMFEKCLRPLMAAAKSPYSANQAAQTLPALFQANTANVSEAQLDKLRSLRQRFITEVICDITSFTNLMLDIFVKGRPLDRVSNLILIRHKQQNQEKETENDDDDNNKSPGRTSLLLSAIPVSATEESVNQALIRGGIYPVLTTICELAKSTAPSPSDDKEEVSSHREESLKMISKLSACFDSLVSLMVHVPSLVPLPSASTSDGNKNTNINNNSSIKTSNNNTNTSAADQALFSVCEVLIRVGITCRSEIAGKVCTAIFALCTDSRVSGGLRAGVFFPATFLIRDICIGLMKKKQQQQNNKNRNTNDEENIEGDDPVRGWKLIHSTSLFEAVTGALKQPKLNAAVAGYLEAFKEFELLQK